MEGNQNRSKGGKFNNQHGRVVALEVRGGGGDTKIDPRGGHLTINKGGRWQWKSGGGGGGREDNDNQ
jgi:hypothetical protein